MRPAAALILVATVAATTVALAPLPIAIAMAVLAVLVAGWVMQPSELEPSRLEPPLTPRPPADDVASRSFEWIEMIPCGVLLLDADLVTVRANEAALSLWDRPRSEVEGVSLIRVVRDHNIPQITREGAGVPREIEIRDGDSVRLTASRLDEPLDGVTYVLALEDLTELRHAQRARSDLVANASHELRTPVTAALALAETLERGVPDEEQRQGFHSRLTKEVLRLSEIVEGLLNLSRLESHSDEFNVEPLLPNELIEVAAQRIAPLLSANQSIELDSGCELPVAGDHDRVLEVLSNLLDNALRVSTDDGTVTIATIEGEDEVRFEVRDDGPGIILHDRARVFERFYTGDEARTASENNGLGLAIARHIVTRLGGRIWVADRTPGATLCFTLPLSSAVSTDEAES